MNVIFDPNALADTQERLFPTSRHRSKRIRKKLLKRHGGEFRKQPCIWRAGYQIIAHPSFRSQLQAAIPLVAPDAHVGTNSTYRGSWT